MSRVQSILKRLDKVLTKFAPTDRTVYSRAVTRTGGDDAIGRPGVVTNTDIILSPQPMWNRPTRRGIEYLHNALVIENGVARTAVDYIMLISPDALTQDQLQDPNTFIVMKDAAGVTEVFLILDVQATGFAGTDVVFEVALRSMTR
jgi:hypothetical protein